MAYAIMWHDNGMADMEKNPPGSKAGVYDTLADMAKGLNRILREPVSPGHANPKYEPRVVVNPDWPASIPNSAFLSDEELSIFTKLMGPRPNRNALKNFETPTIAPKTAEPPTKKLRHNLGNAPGM